MFWVWPIFRKLKVTNLYDFNKHDLATKPFDKIFQNTKNIPGKFFESFTEPLKLELI